MANYGLIVTLAGYDVDSATPEQCALHSDYANPKIRTDASPAHFDYVNYTFSSNPAPGSRTNLVTVAHGYATHTPAHFVQYRQNSGSFETGYKVLPWYYSTSNGFARCIAYTDGTNLKIDFIRDNTGDPTFDNIDFTGLNFDFKYYIFVEQGA